MRPHTSPSPHTSPPQLQASSLAPTAAPHAPLGHAPLGRTPLARPSPRDRAPSSPRVALVLKLSALTVGLALIALLGGRGGARWLAALVPTSPVSPPSASSEAVQAAPPARASVGLAEPGPSVGASSEPGESREHEPPGPLLPTSAPTSAPTSEGLLPDGRVVLNLASEAELGRLPGVGAKKARAIAALRERRGRFHHLEELLEVKGIGRRALSRLRPRVVLDH